MMNLEKSYKLCKTLILKCLNNKKIWTENKRTFFSKPFDVQKEKTLLKKEVEDLKNDPTCFIKSTETFQNILGSQGGSAEKSGFGVKDPNKIIDSFVPQKAEAKLKLKCSYCDRLRHIDSLCFHKKKFIKKNKINLSSKRSHLNRSESSQKSEKAYGISRQNS